MAILVCRKKITGGREALVCFSSTFLFRSLCDGATHVKCDRVYLANITNALKMILKRSTGNGIGVLVINSVTENNTTG